jgi:MFS family permease
MPPKLTTTHWLVIIIGSIGFLFDTYELLMTPLAAPPALAEFLKPSHPNPIDLENQITLWIGRLLWMSALCGGVFGLLGGWLIDRLGRKTVMAASIFVYSFSPVCAAYSTTLGAFVFFRCTTFIGVCVEFIAAVTWMAELFEDKTLRARWLGITQAFASVGGVLVTFVNGLLLSHPHSLPVAGLPVVGDAPGAWRYLLLTGLLPAIPIAFMLPFVPESRIWKEKRAAGTLKRPSFRALFAPELRKVTLLTAALSACAYGIAFGTLQVTVSRAAGALPELQPQAKALGKLSGEGAALNKEYLAKKSDPAAADALLTQIKANVIEQKKVKSEIQKAGTHVQFFQEMGGMLGRIALALLLIAGLARRSILRLFQVPAVIAIPVAYFVLFPKGGDAFFWAYGLCGFLTVAQFSYFGEYLPKVFPLHLRGTGGSFATNVGGRMIGTSAALLTTSVLAPLFATDPSKVLPANVASAAGWLGTGVAVVALVLGSMLPEPKDTEE